jgi:hypothetical protein
MHAPERACSSAHPAAQRQWNTAPLHRRVNLNSRPVSLLCPRFRLRSLYVSRAEFPRRLLHLVLLQGLHDEKVSRQVSSLTGTPCSRVFNVCVGSPGGQARLRGHTGWRCRTRRRSAHSSRIYCAIQHTFRLMICRTLALFDGMTRAPVTACLAR